MLQAGPEPEIINAWQTKPMKIFRHAGTFRESAGRIALVAMAGWQGNDLFINLAGGRAHIGAIALACPSGEASSFCVPGHKDDIPATSMAIKIAGALNCNVAVEAGIHYPEITPGEIAQVLKLSDILAYRIICHETASRLEKPMITMRDLLEFEKYIRSGTLEEDFKCGSEENRYQILELLEKLMDVSELADEAATRLIFRGLPGVDAGASSSGSDDSTLQ